MSPTTKPSTKLHAPGQSQWTKLQASFSQHRLLDWVLRYGLAVATVAAGFGLRLAATASVGSGLPTYVTFYPAVMVTALLAGFGPGVLATALTGAVAAYWILPPTGQWAIASPVDRLGLVVFAGMGLFMSVVAELYRRNRQKAAAYDREAGLRESQARLATFAAATFEGIVESEAGRIVDCNEQFARMLGYTVDELLGMEISSLIFPEDRDRVMVNILESRESLIEHAMRRKDGTRIFVEACGRPNSPGSARRHTANRDITASKQMEEMFRQAQKMEAVGRLAGGVAHDFNNLLSVIIGYSELILERPDTDTRVRQRCEEIKRAGDRAASLTRQLLAFSRQQVLEPRIINLNTFVTDIGKMLQRLIGEDIELRTSLDPGLGSVKADPGQIEQIIMNLAVNARDAMQEGGKLVIETANAVMDDKFAVRHPPSVAGSYVLLSVTDTGVGMNEETKARIFEPFFTTKEVGKGTGLGLSTVYGVVKQSGGFIWVYSEPGQGSVFKIYLPRTDEPEQPSRPAESAPELFRGTENVLLVEDEQAVRTLTRNLLENSGYVVLEADNGANAIEVAKQHLGPIHLLLTDVVMLGMKGPALAEKILAIHPEAKTLYVSGYAGSFGTQTGLIPEGASLVQKPFSRVTLLKKMRNLLDVREKSEET